MPHWIKILLVALLFLLAGAIPLAMQRSTSSQGWGVLEGLLTDDDGPVAGAMVEAHNTGSGAMTRSVSDAQGFFRFSKLPRGAYSLWITHDRHNPVSVPRVFVEEGATTRKDVRLVPGSRRSESASPQ